MRQFLKRYTGLLLKAQASEVQGGGQESAQLCGRSRTQLCLVLDDSFCISILRNVLGV